MKRTLAWTLFGLSLAAAVVAEPPPQRHNSAASSEDSAHVFPSPIPPDTHWVFVLEAGNRLYPEWKEQHTVKIFEGFPIGDTEFTARVTKFIPDFRMIDGKPTSWTLAPSNPAVRVFVYADSGAVDSTWAFQNFPPHFSAKSFFTFKLQEVRGYRPPPDSSGTEHGEGN